MVAFSFARFSVLVFICLYSLSQVTSGARTVNPPFLNKNAQSQGKLWFGTATDIPGPEQQDVAYMRLLNNTKMFGQVTATNYMKRSLADALQFVYTEPERGRFNYTGGNVVVAIAQQHRKKLRCHNLIWAQQLPNWLTSQQWSNETLISIMRNHIHHLVSYWGADCYSWDVVNEAFNSDGSYSSSIWYDTIGEAYLPLAFQFAAETVQKLQADIKLYYNDFGIEYPGTKQSAVVDLVSKLQSQNIKIDGVGLESHFLVGATPDTSSQVQAMQSYVSLGLEVAVTELDVRFTNVSTQTNATGFAIQAQDYYDTVSACMQVDACIGVTVWDFDDQYSWIPSTYPGQGAADIFSANLTRKPAYTACIQALQGKTCTVCDAH